MRNFLNGELLILIVMLVFNPILALTFLWLLVPMSAMFYVYYYCLGLKGTIKNTISTEWILGTLFLLVFMLIFNDVTSALYWTLLSSLCYGVGIVERYELLLGE